MFHYSLKSLMLLIVGASVFCALFFAFPTFVTAILFFIVYVFSAPAIIAGCVYFRQGTQAFCIGCAVPTVFTLTTWGGYGIFFGYGVFSEGLGGDDSGFAKLVIFAYLVVVGLSGLISWGVFRFAKRQNASVSLPFAPTSSSADADRPMSETGRDVQHAEA